MDILKSIFGSKKKKDNASLFYEKVSIALNKCKIEKDKEIENISNAKKWAKDVILEIFDVPSAFWYVELDEYENIKFHDNNLSVSSKLVEETDKVIKQYREQIKLSISRIDFCNTVIAEYEDIIERYKKALSRINQLKDDKRKIHILNKHKMIISKMQSKTGNFEEIFDETGTLDSLNDDIQKIEDDFKIKQEVTEYIADLDKEFSADVDNFDSLPIRKEIEKITSDIKKIKI